MKKGNPVYRVPEITVLLGEVLDLDIERGNVRYRVDSFDNWQLLAPTNATEQEPGYAKLYLVEGAIDELEPIEEETIDTIEKGSETYAEWHKREPSKIAELETADNIGYCHGRVTRIGYRSDKWNKEGEKVDYDHLFVEGDGIAPKIYTDKPSIEASKTAVIVGGDFTVSERGIE